MFKIGDKVWVQAAKDIEPYLCTIIDLGPDENGTIWYMCDPVDFHFPREFTARCLTLAE